MSIVVFLLTGLAWKAPFIGPIQVDPVVPRLFTDALDCESELIKLQKKYENKYNEVRFDCIAVKVEGYKK